MIGHYGIDREWEKRANPLYNSHVVKYYQSRYYALQAYRSQFEGSMGPTFAEAERLYDLWMAERRSAGKGIY